MIRYQQKGISKKKQKALYQALVKPRLIEEKMLILLRQGKISKWFSGIGQEAVSVGATLALQSDEYILPMHRNLGVFTSRNIPLYRLFAQFQGKLSGFTKGRDRSFHFGTNDFHIVGMISHLGAQLGVADGIALGQLLDQSGKVTLVFSGDGGASEGDFHEALNVAAVWNLPVIFIIENNGYGLSTPSSEQFVFDSFIQKGPGYGIATDQVDGNNVLDVFECVNKWAEKIRKNPQPVLIEARTFRMRGHEEASGTKYVPKELMDHWSKKDPVTNFESYLVKNDVLTKEEIDHIKKEIRQEINEGIALAYSEPIPEAHEETEVGDLFRPSSPQPIAAKSDATSDKRFVDAVSDGLKQSLERHPGLVFMGQDIAEYGGVFKVSEGFVDAFGKERIRNTPICESAIIGAGLGLSVMGRKSVIEMQFADFVSCGFNQIVNNLAKSHYRWGQNADVVIRMPTGAGVNAGPFHSQSNEAWFFHTPGLKIVYPSNPYDAKGLLTASIEDPNPVLFFEHKKLYRSVSEVIPDDFYTLEIGQASIVKEGEDMTIVTYGMGVLWARELAEKIPYDLEIIDLRSLVPLDKDTIEASVKKTGKALILHEDTLTGGIGGEIASWIGEHCFASLDGPVTRVASLDIPVPFGSNLEKSFLADNRLEEKVRELAEF